MLRHHRLWPGTKRTDGSLAVTDSPADKNSSALTHDVAKAAYSVVDMAFHAELAESTADSSPRCRLCRSMRAAGHCRGSLSRR